MVGWYGPSMPIPAGCAGAWVKVVSISTQPFWLKPLMDNSKFHPYLSSPLAININNNSCPDGLLHRCIFKAIFDV